tara:strand:- start:113 stop:898 length:786 start_codon:yes stop_codon:yes gene_type:complete
MFNFFKNKNFIKISVLLGISVFVFLGFFISENSIFKNFEKVTNKGAFFNKLSENYNNFFEIKKVYLNGRSKSNIVLIKNVVNSSLEKNANILQYNIVNVKNSLEQLNWINKVYVRKVFPSQIVVKIEEHEEFAIFKKNEKNYLLSKEGKFIYEIKDPSAYELMVLEGKQALKNIYEVEKFFSENADLKKKISKIVIFPNDRWNIVINNILFKLPRNKKETALKEIDKFLNLKKIEMVDLRFFEKKIYVKINEKKIAMKNKK